MNKMTATRVLGTGHAALEVSAIGYGCMGLDSAWGTPMQPDDAITLLRQAHVRGVRFFDTAEAYGQGSNELLVGQALEPIRDQVVIATKFGFADGRPANGADSRPEPNASDRSPTTPSDGSAQTTSTSSTNTASTPMSP
jgi:aryl-alcohol dehydrogenase-like predicted oxidoreductase